VLIISQLHNRGTLTGCGDDGSATLTRVREVQATGQFDPRSVLDAIASLDDILVRAKVANPVIPELAKQHGGTSTFWQGLARPQRPIDH
jgi:hypothetical protein